VSLERGAGSEE
jgi:hypothetical protein